MPIRFVVVIVVSLSPIGVSAQDAPYPAAAPAPDSAEQLPAPPPATGNSGPLTLDDFQQLALQNNPTLAVAIARVQAAQGRWYQAGRYPNPVVGYHANEVGNLHTAGAQGVFVSQKFLTAGRRRLDQSVEAMAIEEARWHVDAQQQRILNDVRIRFYDTLAANRRIELTRQLARIGNELVHSSEKLLATGQITDNSLLQAEIESESAHILYDNAINENDEAWRRMLAVVGVSEMQMVPVDGDLESELPNYQWEECHAMVLGQSPELEAAMARVNRARQSWQRASRESIPNVDVSVSARHHNVTSDDVANIQVGIPLPVFDRNRGNIHRAWADVVAARGEVRRIELDLEDRLAIAFRRFASARQQADRYSKSILPRAKKSLTLVSNGYAAGQVDYLTLITAQRTFFQVSLAHLDALRDLQQAAALLNGRLLSGSLKRQAIR